MEGLMEKIMTSKDALKEQIEEEMAAIALSINDKSVDLRRSRIIKLYL